MSFNMLVTLLETILFYSPYFENYIYFILQSEFIKEGVNSEERAISTYLSMHQKDTNYRTEQTSQVCFWNASCSFSSAIQSDIHISIPTTENKLMITTDIPQAKSI